MHPLKLMAVLALVVVGFGVTAMSMRGGDQGAVGSGPSAKGPTGGAPVAVTSETRNQPATGPGEAEPMQIEVPIVLFEMNEAGARRAAITYLEATEEAVQLTALEAGGLQRTFATRDFADEFGRDTERRMGELLAAVPGGITLRVAPIEARSEPDGEGWIVSVWYVQTITLLGEGVVDDWRTVTYRLRWEDDAWKIAAFDSERGPMPGRGTEPASAGPVQFEALLVGFSDEGLG